MATARIVMMKSRSAKSASPLSGSSAPARPAARLVPGPGLVRQLREVEAVHEVPENRQALFVNWRLRLFFVVAGLVRVRDDAGGVHHLRGDEDRTFGADRKRDSVGRSGVKVEVASILPDV